jgi:chromosome segregation ATPase
VIEQIMIFALGFLFAGLAALAFAPAFWRRANRLTRRRLETQVPLSVQEILAERDQLRAEFAVEQRRVELRAAQTNLAHAADRADLGRRAAEISALKEKLEQRTQENREYEQMLTQSEADLSEALAELGAVTKALYDAEGLYQRRHDALVELAQAHEAVTNLAEERLANHAASEARAVALELRLGDVSRQVLETERRLTSPRRLTERIAQVSKLSDALALLKRDLEHGDSNGSALQKRLEAEAARAERIAREFEALRAQREGDQNRLRLLAAQVATHEAALEDAKRREKRLREQRDQQVEKYDRLQSEYAGLQGLIDAGRRRCEALEADLSALRSGRQKKPSASEPRDEAGLWQDGKDIGTVVRLSRAPAEAPQNGAASETSAETEKPSLRVVSPAAPADAEPAE